MLQPSCNVTLTFITPIICIMHGLRLKESIPKTMIGFYAQVIHCPIFVLKMQIFNHIISIQVNETIMLNYTYVVQNYKTVMLRH